MWSAAVVSTEKTPEGMAKATVRFTSDNPENQPIVQSNFGDSFDDKALNDWVYYRLQSLNAGDTSFAALKLVPLGPIIPTKPVDSIPDII